MVQHHKKHQEQIDAADFYQARNKFFRFTERAAHEAGFADHFNQRIRPVLEQLEVERVKKVKAIFFRLFLSLFLLFVGGLFFPLPQNTNPDLILTLCVVFVAIFSFYPYRHYRSTYKKNIMPQLVKFGGDFSYHAKGTISPQVIEDCVLAKEKSFKKIAKGEDYIKGFFHGCEISILEHRADAQLGGRPFKGLVAHVALPKALPTQLILRKDMGLGWFSASPDLPHQFRFNDDTYGRRYKVFATQQQTALKVLSPRVMSHLHGLSLAFRNAMIHVSIYQKDVLLFIPFSQNLFEPGSIAKQPYKEEDFHIFLELFNRLDQLSEELVNKLVE